MRTGPFFRWAANEGTHAAALAVCVAFAAACGAVNPQAEIARVCPRGATPYDVLDRAYTQFRERQAGRSSIGSAQNLCEGLSELCTMPMVLTVGSDGFMIESGNGYGGSVERFDRDGKVIGYSAYSDHAPTNPPEGDLSTPRDPQSCLYCGDPDAMRKPVPPCSFSPLPNAPAQR